VSQHHLARAHEAVGNTLAAIVAQRRALELRPEFFVARLHFGALLERSGEQRQALLQFARALRDAQSKGRWTNPSTTPEPLRPLVEHAVRVFRTGRRALFFCSSI
jgi:hypothetical protein